jgi:energy-coupling factor transporter ATP-binding protein EcfA2
MLNIVLNNFRSFKNQQFDLSRVNILIGENSSGKSSLIKFLMMISKSRKLNSSSFKFSSELGKYSDFIHAQNTNLSLGFEFLFGEDYTRFFLDNFKDLKEWSSICKKIEQLSVKEQGLKLKFSFNKNIQKSNAVNISIEHNYYGKVEIKRVEGSNKEWFNGRLCKLTYTYVTDGIAEVVVLNELGYDQHGFMTHIYASDLEKLLQDKYSSNAEFLFRRIAHLLLTQNFIGNLLDKLKYINPIDSKPERIYHESEEQGFYPVKTIHDVVNILTDETIEKKIRDGLLDRLNNSLREYGILYEIRLLNSGFGAKELQVQVSKNSIWSNIKDVGYGSALQIPILFQAIVGEDNGGEIIIIEQPEIHIHPFLQSKFIECLLNLGHNNSYIIETHSEDIIRKLQVLAKKKTNELEHDSIKIYYFKRGDNNISNVSKHLINEYGKLLPSFPSGFYDSSSSLVKELF